MVSKSALRRRPKQGAASSPPKSSPDPAPSPPTPLSAPSALRPKFIILLKVISSTLFGLFCAASLSSLHVSVALFISTIFVVFAALLRVFISVLGSNDNTPIPLPTVYKADGTVIRQDQLTVLEHDKRFAHHYAAELPGLAVAAAWFHLWAQVPGVFMVYALYTTYRIINHPLFRIHLFEDNGPGTERPFGISPLFKENDSRVRIVAGSQQFHDALQNASSSTLVVVDASAPWCAPCQQFAPIFRKLADEYPTVTFLTIDVDVSQDVATELAISSVPSFLFFMNNQRLELIRGGTEQKIRDAIAAHM